MAESGRRRRRRVSRQLEERMLARLMTAERMLAGGPAELAEAFDLTPGQLIEWAGDPQNMKRLASLARLSDVLTQLLIARYRSAAAMQLLTLASKEEGGETARKACVDLLKVELSVFDDSGKDAGGDSVDAPFDAQRVLEAMERLGREE